MLSNIFLEMAWNRKNKKIKKNTKNEHDFYWLFWSFSLLLKIQWKILKWVQTAYGTIFTGKP